jgi:hypothetical protein
MTRRARTYFGNDLPRQAQTKWQDIPPVMDDEDAVKTEYREAAEKLKQFSDKRDMFICAESDPEKRLLRYEATVLSVGNAHILNSSSAMDLARLHHVSKGYVNSIIRRFQEFLNLPPAPGQREADTRRKQSITRKGQLK